MLKVNRGDLFARLLGILVFLAGIAIILWVLWIAYQLFQDPNLGAPAHLAPKADPSLAAIAQGFGRLLFRILLLCLGSYSGSLVAHKGVFLYFSGLHGGPAILSDRPAPAQEPPSPPVPPAAPI